MPALDAAQRAHSAAPCAPLLRRHIEARGGWLRLRRVPGAGALRAGPGLLQRRRRQARGARGTSPPRRSSRRCSAPASRASARRSCASGGELLELGAGSGALAEVLLPRLAAARGAAGAATLFWRSAPTCASASAQRLARLPSPTCTRAALARGLPAQRLRGVILANEVADALPFQCFAVSADGYVERGVALDGQGEPCWAERPGTRSRCRLRLVATVGLAAAAVCGRLSQRVCLRVGPWLAASPRRWRRAALLLFDYGLGPAGALSPAARCRHAALPLPPSRAR